MGMLRVTGYALGVLFLVAGCTSATLKPESEAPDVSEAEPMVLTEMPAKTVTPAASSAPSVPLVESAPAAEPATTSPATLPPIHIRGPMNRPEAYAFVEEMARLYNFDRVQLAKLFSQIKPRPKVVEAISRPAEAQPWHKYRPRFIQAQRIDKGVAFWRANTKYFDAAQAQFGVPTEIVAAILGVETLYGKHAGGFRVVDSLATLGFDYAPRAAFFRKELQEFLILSREQGWDPRAIQGSYAGAMGLGQFMPSSYRRFAVDFDGDGKRDLHRSTADAIGSVAYYLQQHGWGAGAPIVTQASTQGETYTRFISRDFKAETPLAEMRDNGVTWDATIVAERAGLFELENTGGKEHWLGFPNFYAITRYNRSVLYSMAVYELAQEILRGNAVRLTESN
ncbi:MAG: lytic murein transglycosylase B [Gammaproteobacteria bacterium]|nr:lytic murein transglycosylase B [Gammaproteobacteria bacterium]